MIFFSTIETTSPTGCPRLPRYQWCRWQTSPSESTYPGKHVLPKSLIYYIIESTSLCVYTLPTTITEYIHRCTHIFSATDREYIRLQKYMYSLQNREYSTSPGNMFLLFPTNRYTPDILVLSSTHRKYFSRWTFTPFYQKKIHLNVY